MNRRLFEDANFSSAADLFRALELAPLGGPLDIRPIDDSKTDSDGIHTNAHGEPDDGAAAISSDDFLALSSSGAAHEPSAQSVEPTDAVESSAATLLDIVSNPGSSIATDSGGDLDVGDTLTVVTNQALAIPIETPALTWSDSGIVAFASGSGAVALASGLMGMQVAGAPDLQVLNLNGPITSNIDMSGDTLGFEGTATHSTGALQAGTTIAGVSSANTTGVSGNGQAATQAQGGFIISISYDSSANSAPAAFKTAISYVVSLLEATFTDNVTININVGWGEVGGQALGGALGASIRAAAPAYTYSQIRNALLSDGNSAADATALANLANSDPTNGGNFDIGSAAAKALGLLSPNGSGTDGWVGFTSAANTFTFDPNNLSVSGLYDFIGVALHEITEVMGRVAWLGNFIDYANAYSVMDLFRYSAPGVRSLVGGQPSYFSIDGGQTNLDNFNTNSSGDFGDWAASAGHDAFLAFSSSGVANLLTASDVTLLDAIGWNTTNAPPPPPTTVVSSVTTSGPGIVNGNGDLKAGQVVTLTVGLSQVVTVAGGTPTLTLNDGAIATFVSGSGTNSLVFNYTVVQGQNTPDLQVSSFNLNGSTLVDGSGNNPNFSGAVTNPVGILQIDTIAPVVSSVTIGGVGITNGNGDLGVGRSVTITANMSEIVSVTGGSPTLTLNDGGTATFNGGSGTSVLSFIYTVAQGQNTADLQVAGLNLNGAAIYDSAGNSADPVGAATNPVGVLQIDTISPTLRSIVETPSNGTLQPGQSASIILGFSEAVLVAGGVPTLTLNDGGAAIYQSGSGTSSLVFSYPVNAHDINTTSLSVVSIHLGTATISDGAGNAAGLLLAGLPQVGPQIDTTTPTVVHVAAFPSSGLMNAGNLVTITLTLNEAVTVSGGTPALILNDGGIATYNVHNSTATSLAFDYVVGAADQTPNLAIVSVKEPNGTSVRDSIGHDADFSSAIASVGTGLQVGAITNNTISGSSANDTFYAFATNVSFTGGGGHDTVIFDGARAQYNVTSNGDGSITVVDGVANRDFSHHILNLEIVQFSDKIVFVENADNANIARLYSAALNRAPDTGGLTGWEDIYAAHISAAEKAGGVYEALAQTGDGFGTSIAGGFTQSVEFQTKYGSLMDADFVTQLYLNVLNRTPATAELSAWLGLIQNGDASGVHFTRDMVLVGFAESPENIAKTAADWLIQI